MQKACKEAFQKACKRAYKRAYKKHAKSMQKSIQKRMQKSMQTSMQTNIQTNMQKLQKACKSCHLLLTFDKDEIGLRFNPTLVEQLPVLALVRIPFGTRRSSSLILLVLGRAPLLVRFQDVSPELAAGLALLEQDAGLVPQYLLEFCLYH